MGVVIEINFVKVTRLDVLSIECVKLRHSSIPRLRKPKPAAQEADESGEAENKANFTTQVTRIGVEHVWKHEADQPLNRDKHDVGETLRARS